MKKVFPSNMWVGKYDGEPMIFKATFEEMEYAYRNDPKMGDYVILKAFKFEKKEKRMKGKEFI